MSGDPKDDDDDDSDPPWATPSPPPPLGEDGTQGGRRVASKLAMMCARSSGGMCSHVRMCLCILELRPESASTLSKASTPVSLTFRRKDGRSGGGGVKLGASSYATFKTLPLLPALDETGSTASIFEASACLRTAVEIACDLRVAPPTKGCFVRSHCCPPTPLAPGWGPDYDRLGRYWCQGKGHIYKQLLPLL